MSSSLQIKHQIFASSCGMSFNLPSGKLTVCYGKLPFCSWENPLFLWPFSSSLFVCLPGRVSPVVQWRIAREHFFHARPWLVHQLPEVSAGSTARPCRCRWTMTQASPGIGSSQSSEGLQSRHRLSTLPSQGLVFLQHGLTRSLDFCCEKLSIDSTAGCCESKG